MARGYQMPVRTDQAKRVGSRLWRKTILKTGHISKGDVNLDVDQEYLQTLVNNFTAGAKDQVQFVLADAQNRHNENPERFRGDIVDLSVTDDGRLEAVFGLTARGDQLLSDNPKLGASVSVVDRYKRADGRDYGPTLLQVAGTLDPEIAGLGEWSRADLSSERVEFIDLSGPVTTEAPTAPIAPDGPPEEKGHAVPDVKTSDEETLASLRALLPALTKLVQLDGNVDNDGPADEVDTDTDAELDAMAAGIDLDSEDDTADAEPQLVAASAEQREALELAAARIDALEIRNARMQAKLDEETYLKERDQLAREFHVPPRVTDLCREWLTGEKRLELSAGKTANPGDAIRKALKEFAAVGPLDLSAAAATGHEAGGRESRDAENEAFLKAAHDAGFAR